MMMRGRDIPSWREGGGGRGRSTGCLSRGGRGSRADELKNKTMPRPIITVSVKREQGRE